MVYERVESLPPYGMKEVDVNQLPSLPTAYSGSAIISATNPVVVSISKEKQTIEANWRKNEN